MMTNVNIPTINSENNKTSIYDDNQDIIWPTVVGIFVALALGWMICRYKCSSKERSPHIVQCCPKSLCKNIRLCCSSMCKLANEDQPPNSDQCSSTSKARPSNQSLQDTPFLSGNNTQARLSITQSSQQQWPPQFLLDQTPSFPLSITVQTTTSSSEPKRHPLRRESTLPGLNNERRESSLWPFRTINAVFHRETSEIKDHDLFFTV